MQRHSRPRRPGRAALTVALAAVMFVVAACTQDHPNSVFSSRTEFNRDVGFLFDILIWAGTAVFIFVEAILVYALIRYRRRGVPREPEHVHGNTTLEILWTIIPAVILVVIAIPTVRTIFRTQAHARADALQVEVIGHQWWWEFRYPQYGIITANELYLPIGRTANFTLTTKDVLHSFWIPSLGGKRDLISNRVNYLWFTPDSSGKNAWNGFCAEYCGTSHANMRFRAFTVRPEEFQSWVAHQQTPAAFTLPAPAAAAANTAAAVAQNPNLAQTTAPAGSTVNPSPRLGVRGPAGPGQTGQGPTVPSAGPPGVGVPAGPSPAGPPVAQAGFIAFARDSLPRYAVPTTALPAGLSFDTTLYGNAARGAQILTSGQGACLGCHTIKGNPMMAGQIGPNLTHFGSRTSLGSGLYPNDRQHLGLWIKNARKMKPGVIMPTLGLNEYDPVLKAPMKTGGLTDQQIADIVAYLHALK